MTETTTTADEAHALFSALQLLAGVQSKEDMVQRLRQATRRFVGADGICVVLRDGDYVEYVAEDAMAPLFTGQRFKLEFCISGLAIRDRETIVIPEILADVRAPRAAYEPTFVRSMAMAPIGVPEPVASIGAYWAKVGMPDPAAVARLEVIARAASTALQNVHLKSALALAEERMQSVLDTVQTCVYSIDRNWRIIEFNAAAEKFFNHKRETVIGHDYWEVFGETPDAIKAQMRASMTGAAMAVLETKSAYRPGRHVEVRVSPSPDGICVATLDVTERYLARMRPADAEAG